MPEPMNVIYGLSCTCHPELGIRYVGQSSRTARVRFYHHTYAARKKKPWAVSRWMAKHGIENIRQEVLEVLDAPDGLDDAEIAWIEKLGTMIDQGGYNLWPGGRSVRGYKHPEESLSRRKGWKHSDETRERLRQATTGKVGSQAGRATLTEAQVADIRHDLWLGMTHDEVAEKHSTTKGIVTTINRGKSWPHVPWPIGPRVRPRDGRYTKGARSQAKLQESDIRDIRRRNSEGETYASIGRSYGVTGTNISYICKRITWADVE